MQREPGWSVRPLGWARESEDQVEDSTVASEERDMPGKAMGDEEPSEVGGLASGTQEPQRRLQVSVGPAAGVRAPARNNNSEVAAFLKQMSAHQLSDAKTHAEMEYEWPIWRDFLLDGLEMMQPMDSGWSEREMHFILMALGGKHVRDIAAYTAPEDSEVNLDENGVAPVFSNLIKRVNASFRPKDAATEVTLFRAMRQRQGESIREFLERARRQLSRCGPMAIAERERELILLLKSKTLLADDIVKNTLGKNTLQKVEEMARLLESLEERKKQEKQAEVHEVSQEVANVSSGRPAYAPQPFYTPRPQPPASQPKQANESSRPWSGKGRSSMAQQKGDRCQSCGRKGGHDQGFRCPATNSVCFACNKRGHRAEVCGSQGTSGQGTSSTGLRNSNAGAGGRATAAGKGNGQRKGDGDRAVGINQVSAYERVARDNGWEDWE